MARIPKPNYTQAPNVLLDELLPDIKSLAELKVILVVVRATIGWHEDEQKLTFSDLEDLTGLSRVSVDDGVKRAIARGVVERRIEGAGGAREAFYTLNLVGKESSPTSVKDLDRPWLSTSTEVGKETAPAPIEEKKTERNTPGTPLACEGGDLAKWGEVMEDLRSLVPSITWHWLENLCLVDRRGDVLVLQAPDEQATWIRLKHMATVEAAAARAFGPTVTVELPVSETEAMRQELEQRAPRQRRQRRRSA